MRRESHERWDLKKRKKPASLADAKIVTIAQILDWKIPAGYKKTDNDAIPPRETRLYTVSGFVRKTKLSPALQHRGIPSGAGGNDASCPRTCGSLGAELIPKPLAIR